MTKEIKTEILINSSPKKVWDTLTNTSAYSDWNPFIKKIKGYLKVGERLEIIIQPVNSSKMTFRPVVLDFEENKMLRWKGKFIVNGFFDGTHKFELIDNKNGTTTFRQSEIFEGLLVRLFNLENTRDGFVEMNKELKKQCEK